MNFHKDKIFFTISFLIVLLIITGCFSENITEQTSEKLATWHYRGFDDKWRKTYIPTNIQMSLQRDTLLKNLFFEKEFEHNYWTDTVDWEFRTNIAIPKEIKNDNYDLIFYGIIGTADIYLNDSLLFRADNMYRTWQKDVTELLHKGKNNLQVKFKSYEKLKEESNSASSVSLPFKGQEMLRIAEYFSDTTKGIYYIPIGFWKGVFIKKWQTATFEDAYFEVEELEYDNYANIKGSFSIKADKNKSVILKVNYKEEIYFEKKITLKEGLNNYKVEFQIKEPKLWWTHDLGEPFLYNLKSSILIEDKSISSINKNLGIRKIKINTLNNNFSLSINDVKLKLKIINYLPVDMFLDKTTNDNYKKVAKDLTIANINTLHITENGIYEKNNLYDECDKAGILIWQDFMIPYKILDKDDVLLKNIEYEAEEIVKRLRQHPSIAFWSGENFFQKYWDKFSKPIKYSPEDSILIAKTNKLIFTDILPKIAKEYSNIEYFEKIDFKSIINIEDNLPAYPNILTLKKFTKNTSRKLGSEVVAAHERPRNATNIIINEIKKHSKPPKYLSSLTYSSQLYSSEKNRLEIEHHRLNPENQGFICGIYKDYSPVISNSAVDYEGYWKGKMYAIKNAFSKLLIIVSDKNGWVSVKINSDFKENITADFYCKLYDFKGDVLWRRNYLNTIIEPNNVNEYFNLNFSNEISRNGRNNVVFKIDVFINQELFYEKNYYFAPVEKLKLSKPNIKQKHYKVDEGYIIELTTDYLAKNVLLFTEKNGNLSDNYFDIIPGETKKIIFYTNVEIYGIEAAFKSIDYTMKREGQLFNFP